MKERKDIEEKYIWHFDIFQKSEEIEDAFRAIEELTSDAANYYGKFHDKEYFFRFFSTEQTLKLNKFYSFLKIFLTVRYHFGKIIIIDSKI